MTRRRLRFALAVTLLFFCVHLVLDADALAQGTAPPALGTVSLVAGADTLALDAGTLTLRAASPALGPPTRPGSGPACGGYIPTPGPPTRPGGPACGGYIPTRPGSGPAFRGHRYPFRARLSRWLVGADHGAGQGPLGPKSRGSRLDGPHRAAQSAAAGPDRFRAGPAGAGRCAF